MTTTEKAQHTPGPWDNASHNRLVIYTRDIEQGTRLISEVFGLEDEENLANARLIAAAPDMLEALVALRSLIEPKSPIYHDPNVSEWVKLAEAAIRKARGE